MKNPVKKEAVLASASIMATLAGGTLAPILVSVLGVGITALGYLGEKRTKDLFGEDESLIRRIAVKMQNSEDFASLVYDIWLRHNLESSEIRRKYLKSTLYKCTNDKEVPQYYLNFTRILNLEQEIDTRELYVCAAFYSAGAYKFSQFEDRPDNYRLNIEQISKLLASHQVDEKDLITTINQLGHYGLVGVSYNSLGGPYYWPVSFGKTFLKYIFS